MINYNHFITWEMFLNKRLLSKIYFSNRRFVRAIFLFIFCLLLFVLVRSYLIFPRSYATFVSYYFGL